MSRKVLNTKHGVQGITQNVNSIQDCEKDIQNMLLSYKKKTITRRPPFENVGSLTLQSTGQHAYILRYGDYIVVLDNSNAAGDKLRFYNASTLVEKTPLYGYWTKSGFAVDAAYKTSITNYIINSRVDNVSDSVLRYSNKGLMILNRRYLMSTGSSVLNYNPAVPNYDYIIEIKNAITGVSYHLYDHTMGITYTHVALAADTPYTIREAFIALNLPWGQRVGNHSIRIFTDRNVSVGTNSADSDGLISLVGNRVRSVAVLPKESPINGAYIILIASENITSKGYYVQPTIEGQGWIECAGTACIPFASCSPIYIEQVGSSIYVGHIIFTERPSGDADNNPIPTFLKSIIKDTFTYKGRLGFITDKSIHLSDLKDTYQFFQTTSLELLDTAAINAFVGMTGDIPINLRQALATDNGVVLVGEEQSFFLTSAGAITNTSIKVEPTVTIPAEVEGNFRMGNNLFLRTKAEEYSLYHEIITQDDVAIKTALSITADASEYLPNDVIMACTLPNFGLAILSNGTNIYVYQQQYAGNQKEQEAWHKWTYPDTIVALWSDSIDTLYVAHKLTTSTIQIEYLTLGHQTSDTDLLFKVLLDYRYKTQGASYNAETNLTTITLSSKGAASNEGWAIIEAATGIELLTGVTAGVVTTIEGNYTSANCLIVGKYYEGLIELESPLMMRYNTTERKHFPKEIITGIDVSTENTGSYKLLTTVAGKDDDTREFYATFYGGDFSISPPISAQNTSHYRIGDEASYTSLFLHVGESYLPFTLTGYAYVMMLYAQGRR